MAIILHIDTAVEMASVCLSGDNLLINERQKDHAAWIHEAIRSLLTKARMRSDQLEAIAVSIGPGSYTGLRVGLATAKGLCFALKIPLIAINTLELMAAGVRKTEKEKWICPMIDARRMEVFTALYDEAMNEVIAPMAMVLDGHNFEEWLGDREIVFCGNGSLKQQQVLSHQNASYNSTIITAADMVALAGQYFSEKRFADLAYIEPLYLKEFYSPAR